MKNHDSSTHQRVDTPHSNHRPLHGVAVNILNFACEDHQHDADDGNVKETRRVDLGQCDGAREKRGGEGEEFVQSGLKERQT